MAPKNSLTSFLLFLLISPSLADLKISIRPPKEPAAYSKVSEGNGSEEVDLLAPINGPFTTPLCIEEFAYISESEPTDYIDHVVLKVNLTDGRDKPWDFYANATRNLKRLLPNLRSCTIKTAYVRYVKDLYQVNFMENINYIEGILNKVTWAFKTEKLHLNNVEITEEIISDQEIPEDPNTLYSIFAHRVSSHELRTGPVYKTNLNGVPIKIQFRLSSLHLDLGPYFRIPNEWRTLTYQYQRYGVYNIEVILPQNCVRMISTHSWERGLCQISSGRRVNTMYGSRGQTFEFCCNV
ncbi:unnamed protein product [Bursaphelenchus xylophilus]|uniref:(pine wood nematode) hypothetical protein n=1 Tax=Bursaphelenchus xylophilus TaxID=6326 RepID=A0A1I7S5U5_BURXY|nr:unnamed protein product [Bursaphelenchus xylophilus]CAG9125073.1 unnamed protein product [Bursaphelenchus xylophilus]